MIRTRSLVAWLIVFSIVFSFYGPASAQTSIKDLGGKIKSEEIKDDGSGSAAASSESPSIMLNSTGPNGYDGSGNNSCGQYATSTVFNFYGLDETYPVTLQNMNPTGSFTAPDRIVDYWRKNGIDAGYKNKATLEDIKKQLDSGNPAVCMVDADGSGHWITIIGYNKNADGTIKSFVMRDSYWGVNSNKEMSVEEFEKRWTKPIVPTNKVLGTVLDYDHLLITPKGKGDGGFDLKSFLNLPNNFNTATNDQIASGANQFLLALGQDVTKLKSIKDFDIKKVNFPRAIAGAAEALSAVPAKLVFGLPGTALKDGGEAIKNWGSKMSKKEGTLNKIAGGVATGVGTAVNTAGKAITSVGNAVSSVIDSGFKGIRKLFNW